jgi:hypothetical protein
MHVEADRAAVPLAVRLEIHDRHHEACACRRTGTDGKGGITVAADHILHRGDILPVHFHGPADAVGTGIGAVEMQLANERLEQRRFDHALRREQRGARPQIGGTGVGAPFEAGRHGLRDLAELRGFTLPFGALDRIDADAGDRHRQHENPHRHGPGKPGIPA